MAPRLTCSSKKTPCDSVNHDCPSAASVCMCPMVQELLPSSGMKNTTAWKVKTNLDSIKSRDITLPTKFCLVKATIFPVVMYGCESWTIKTAEHWRIDAFELWCWRRLLKSPLDCKKIQPVHPKGDQSWVFIGMTDVEAETPILWPPDAKKWLVWKDPERLKAGGEGDNRGWDGWMASPTQWTWVWINPGSWWWTGKPGVQQSMG